jgi:CRISPR/Cas system CMR-associated protein Cmr5 small subunit
MNYQNLDQVRAKNAIKYKDTEFPGADGGEVVKKVPMLIRDNGILAAAAFAAERKSNGRDLKNSGHELVFKCIIEHLADGNIKRLNNVMDLDKFIEHLSDTDSAFLRDITAESMNYLNYLRRFARKKGDSDNANRSK